MLSTMFRRTRGSLLGGLIACALAAGCDESSSVSWHVVGRDHPSALLSVWGTSATDVYAVGADRRDGLGPLVYHYDGNGWDRLSTGQAGTLWWVFGIPGSGVFMGGDGGMILHYDGGAFTRMSTPSQDTVFGIWGETASDMWAVGGAQGGASGGFAWRLVGTDWTAAPGFPSDIASSDVIWKISGKNANDAWMVGTRGRAVHWDGVALTSASTGIGESLFTVHADANRLVAVGGFGTGTILENDGAGWRDASPDGAPPLIGTYLARGGGYAVGQEGVVFERDSGTWREVALGIQIEQSFHSTWVDPDGGVWAVGGQVQTLPLVDGIMVYGGASPPKEWVP